MTIMSYRIKAKTIYEVYVQDIMALRVILRTVS